MNDKNSVSFIAFEAEMTRQERIIKRLWVIDIVALMALVGTNIWWIIRVVI